MQISNKYTQVGCQEKKSDKLTDKRMAITYQKM